MNTVTLSNSNQLNFPNNISEIYGLEAGDTFEFISYNNRIELIPLKPIKKIIEIKENISYCIISEYVK